MQSIKASYDKIIITTLPSFVLLLVHTRHCNFYLSFDINRLLVPQLMDQDKAVHPKCTSICGSSSVKKNCPNKI